MEMTMEKRAVRGGKEMAGAGGAMFSAFLYGLNAFFASGAYQGGSNPITFTCFSSFFSMLILLLLMLEQKTPVLPKKNQIVWLLLDGVLGGLTTLFLFSAFEQIATGIATVLHFTYPVYVAVAGIWILKKRLTVGKGAAMALSLAGIAFTSDFAGSGTRYGMFLALVSGITYAGYILVMEKSGLQKTDYLWFSFYMTGIRGIVALLYGEAVGTMVFTMTGTAWMMTAAHALLNGVAANILFQFGIRHIGGTTASLLSMFEPVTCVAVGVMLLGEVMSPVKLFGCGLIMAGILLVVLEERGKK
ncbi:MAG: EamA family transporter [Lachnospiraceae bacterium]|nr:EamA family transporter [Lachnospiraceae bacterium]